MAIDTLRSTAHLQRELGDELFLALISSDNTAAVKDFLLSLQPLLNPVGTIKVRPATQFDKHKFFQVNTEKNALVRISYIWENFKKWFLPPSVSEAAVSGGGPYREPGVPGSATEVALRYQTLNKRSVDGPIINQLGGEEKAETTLAEIAALMALQPSSDPGVLFTNGYANIFYVRDVSGVLRAVRVDGDVDGWSVHAHSVEDPGEWDAGRQVFSRDS